MKQLITILFLITALATSAQQPDTRFLLHLTNKGDYQEVIFLTDRLNFNIEQNQKDSIYFLKGWSQYNLKELEASTNSLLKVSNHSPFYLKSKFFAGYNQMHLGNYSDAQFIFNSLKSSDKSIAALKQFESSGLHLLQNNYAKARAGLNEIDSNIPVIHQPLTNLKNIANELSTHRTKSPFLAALMSALVPGTGKIYAGKTGQGIAALITTVGLGFVTWENYNKAGSTHFKTIAFGSLFAGNYIATIYGSAKSVKIAENEYQNAMHNQILFHLHIPLRNYFE